MTVSQKRAIWYKERERKIKEQEAFIKSKGLYADYLASKYRSMTTYIKYGMK